VESYAVHINLADIFGWEIKTTGFLANYYKGIIYLIMEKFHCLGTYPNLYLKV
jgi:hypothetical protein